MVKQGRGNLSANGLAAGAVQEDWKAQALAMAPPHPCPLLAPPQPPSPATPSNPPPPASCSAPGSPGGPAPGPLMLLARYMYPFTQCALRLSTLTPPSTHKLPSPKQAWPTTT